VVFRRLAEGSIAPLPGPSQKEAGDFHVDVARKLCDGLEKVVETFKTFGMIRSSSL